MAYIFDDGGRAAAGYKGTAGDCGARAMAIALQIEYKQAYSEIAEANKSLGYGKSARNGVHKDTLGAILARHGYRWYPAPKFVGRKAYAADMPKGRVIARMSKHFAAVIDGVVHDTFDSTYKMVYGYWSITQ